MTRYVETPQDQIPSGLIWHTPPREQGQIVETSYAEPHNPASGATYGDCYRRIHDRSTGKMTYYRRSDVRPVGAPYTVTGQEMTDPDFRAGLPARWHAVTWGAMTTPRSLIEADGWQPLAYERGPGRLECR